MRDSAAEKGNREQHKTNTSSGAALLHGAAPLLSNVSRHDRSYCSIVQ